MRLKILIYMLAGCFFGLAGLFQLSWLRQGDPTVAAGLELVIIVAVFLDRLRQGETNLTPRCAGSTRSEPIFHSGRGMRTSFV